MTLSISFVRIGIVFLSFWLSKFALADTETASVGKIRASAELAFSKGEIDQALGLWEQVCLCSFDTYLYEIFGRLSH